jgi:hypothetical protein
VERSGQTVELTRYVPVDKAVSKRWAQCGSQVVHQFENLEK